jgi:hypothetical protein
MKKILALIIACTVVVSFTRSSKSEEINVWRKVSTDEMNPGEIVALDMSKGYALADPQYIYIIVKPIGSDEQVIIAFPNGGYWTAPEPDPFLQELQKEFDSLEDYLRNQKSKEIKKK